MSFHDRALLGGTALSRPARIRRFTRDAMMTYDRATIDSTGAFLSVEDWTQFGAGFVRATATMLSLT